MSRREFNHSADEYSKQIEYKSMDIQEYGSQQKYEYNEHVVSMEEDATPPEKSKFKKMIQYVVAGVAGAVIIANNAFNAPAQPDAVYDEIVLELEYDTYTYTVEAGNTYQMSFDESKIDDYYMYLAEYVYKMTQKIDAEKHEELLKYTSDDWNDPNHLNNKMLYKVPDSVYYRTSSGNFGVIEESGVKKIYTAYNIISFGSYDYGEDNIQYSGMFSVRLHGDENLNYLDKMIHTYGGMSKQKIYNSLVGMKISSTEGYFAQTYILDNGWTEVFYRCDEFSIDETFYLKEGQKDLIVPTFLKIINITDEEESIPDKVPDEVPEEEPEQMVIIDGSNLSQKYYEYAEMISDRYYLVKENGLYGVIDFDGNEIIPILHSGYEIVGANEIEFINGKIGSVYDTETGQFIFEYLKEEEIPRQYVETIVGNDGEHIITIAMEKNPEYDSVNRVYREYQGGLLCEEVCVVDDYEEQDEDLFGWTNRARITYIDVSTSQVLYSGYSGRWLNGMEDGFEGAQFDFSDSLVNTKAYVVEYDMSDNSYYLAIIDAQGANRTPIDLSLYQGNKRYYGDWLVMPYTATVVNTQTNESYTMPYTSEEIKRWYHGKDEYYGLGRETENGSMVYALCKKDTILINNCVALGFIGDTYLMYSVDGKEYIITDYNLNELCRVVNCSGIQNGTALVYDGEGIYMVDSNFQKISDYIYKGTLTNCTYGVVQLEDKYYLLKTTE